MVDHVTPETISPLDTAEALAVWFSALHCAIVWRDGPGYVRPVDGSKRISELQPGDQVVHHGELRTVRSISIYR